MPITWAISVVGGPSVGKDLVGTTTQLAIVTPILEAIKNIVDPANEVVYYENPESDFVKYDDFSCAIIVVGELPYAESMGDNMNLMMPTPGGRW